MLYAGVDVGGTFTDLFAYDDESGETFAAKVPTTVDNQAVGVLSCIAAAGLEPARLDVLSHGTTTGLNALIERKGAICGLLTTEGFRDVLEIMRTDRRSGYDLRWRKPQPFVPRHLRLEVPERVLADGTVERPLDENAARTAIRRLVADGVESIAVCLLHAYANPVHERRLLELIREEAPDVAVSLSSDVNAELREFERTNTVVIDAYIKPVMVRYIRRLAERLEADGFTGRLLLMQGSGGMVTPDRACEKPIVTLSSGPAAGAIAAATIAQAAGVGDIVTFDVGGTSTDVALVHDGEPYLDGQKQVEWGLPARVPMIDVASVGAGGGSIGWVDEGGLLKMGPRSAGSTPGPVCYGKGGSEPTLSDALLVKGILGPSIADGALELDVDAAREQIGALAERLDLPLERVVSGMVEIAQANMANAVRSVSIWKGLDPRDLTLVAFGGAGGMVAGPVAAMLDIPTVLVPPVPGNSCAMGTLMTDYQEDTAVAYLARADDVDLDTVNRQLAMLRDQALAALSQHGMPADAVELAELADIRYHGQIHELQVPFEAHPVTGDVLAATFQAFEEAYEETYTIRLANGLPEIVSLRVRARVRLPHYAIPDHRDGHDTPEPTAAREVIHDGETFLVDVYERAHLKAGTTLDGPVILEEPGSTVWVAPGMGLEVDRLGNLIIHTLASADAMRRPALAGEEV
ncbi:MAG: hydantoinase/oxoprolinase family protein [Solirubrobacteraceae bacterium]|nr:hydantoinase/oxoprolinase family protein [Solirubrobacteraceae bacterium]